MSKLFSNFTPKCEQEEVDVALINKYYELFDDIYSRENTLCHLTSSAFIVNQDFTKVLVIYHNIYDSWSWVGGHADGDHDLLHVALKETNEETGLNIENIKVLEDAPVSIEVLPVASHVRKGKFVSCHTHLSVCYLFQANEKDNVRILEDENSGVCWMDFDEFLNKTTEPHMKPAYQKIIKYIREKYKK